jgi:hypothetical protein
MIKIEVAGISIAQETLDNLASVAASINKSNCTISLCPEHDMLLSVLAQRLRYEHGLKKRNGISKATLLYLILDNALKMELPYSGGVPNT